MEQKLRILLNTLMTIETKGEGTKTMAQCLAFTEGLIREAAEEAAKKAEVQGDTESCEAK